MSKIVPRPDARERAEPVFPPPLGEEETQAQRVGTSAAKLCGIGYQV